MGKEILGAQETHASGSEAIALAYKFCHLNWVLGEERTKVPITRGEQCRELHSQPSVLGAVKNHMCFVLNCICITMGANPLVTLQPLPAAGFHP